MIVNSRKPLILKHFLILLNFIGFVIFLYMPTKTADKSSADILKAILKEIRSLREEFFLSSSSEDLDDFAHPSRIKKSYLKALKKYPPRFQWK